MDGSYYPFGMLMPGRWNSSEGYRYGFNGKEIDDDMKGGTGATYDYGFRIYDSRIAKFLSVDPLTKDYPWYTPYQFAGNMPIWAIDLDGLEEADPPKLNIIINIADEESVVKDWEKNATTYNNWHVIYAKTSEEASNKLNSYLGDNMAENLVFHSHGYMNTIQTEYWTWNTGKHKYDRQYHIDVDILTYYFSIGRDGSKVPYTSVGVDDHEIDAIENISLKVKKGGNLIFTACHGGYDLDIYTDKWAKALSELTYNRLKIYLNTGKSKRVEMDPLDYWLRKIIEPVPPKTSNYIEFMNMINKDPEKFPNDFEDGFRVINRDGTHHLLRDDTGGKGTIILQDSKKNPVKFD